MASAPEISKEVGWTDGSGRYSLRNRFHFATRESVTSIDDNENSLDYQSTGNLSKRRCTDRTEDSLVVRISIHSDAGRSSLSSILSTQDQNQSDAKELSPTMSSKTMETGQPNYPITRLISTSFAHPMTFDHEPPPDGSKPCHWCNNFVYGIVGLGKKMVEVVDFGNGKYLEIEDGHTSQGHEPSRMCVVCALERIHIMRCPAHRFIRLRGYSVETFDFSIAYDSLTQLPGQRPPEQTNPWCSLCPNPAFFGCSTLQCVNKFQEPVEWSSRDAIGCGLLLCNLAQVTAKNEQSDPEYGSRADVIYLLPGNDMYRHYTGF
ncbi:hypothetical protein BDV25DRAFT_168964 [Aspergillus avenaceus]|uniref:Uncharacterized protein n=1 Tax=Aspergillus avenaceus TaxID=36643 RepID=A0A5N6TNI2_ASPAV|nr:hypothetical protein BDV25DRAFT_168964 [Aspergillus avenaceus]